MLKRTKNKIFPFQSYSQFTDKERKHDKVVAHEELIKFWMDASMKCSQKLVSKSKLKY